MSDMGAPPPCVSLPAVVVGGRLGLPVTPLTSPVVGPPVMPETTAVALDEVELEVETDDDGVDEVVITVCGVEVVVVELEPSVVVELEPSVVVELEPSVVVELELLDEAVPAT